MAMSDCIKCWGTPCTCGYDYRKMKKEQRIKQASVVLGVDAEELKQLLGTFVPERHPWLDEK